MQLVINASKYKFWCLISHLLWEKKHVHQYDWKSSLHHNQITISIFVYIQKEDGYAEKTFGPNVYS